MAANNVQDLNTTILNFLRDAQYRVAELAAEIYRKKEVPEDFSEEEAYRNLLVSFMNLLYEPSQQIKDRINYIPWPEKEIRQEMDFLRRYTGMADAPQGFWAPEITQIIARVNQIGGGGGGGSTIPQGTPDQVVGYDNAGNPLNRDFPLFAGYQGGGLATYFAGR